MRVLVTGGLGFIGSNLTAELQDRGHEVGVVDRRMGANYERDLRYESLSGVLRAFAPEYVVHLAAQVGRLFGEDDVRESVRSNAEITTAVALDCAEFGIPLAYASTSEIYGDQAECLCVEDGPKTLPHNIYGLSKRWGEEACQLYTVDPLICRLSMPYGPGAPPGRGRRALDTFLWQAHYRKPITVHKGAERSWCWIGDTVTGMAHLIENGYSGAWNIGRDDCPVAMVDLAKMCCDLAGAPHSLIQLVDPPMRQTAIKRLATGKLRGLGWHPTVELEQGLVAVYEWIRNFDEEGKWKSSDTASFVRPAVQGRS